jgi:hypothetical protein
MGLMASLRHQVRIKASRPIVYECLTTESGIGAWWNRPRASSSDGNSFWEFEPGPEHGVLRVRVESSVPDKHPPDQSLGSSRRGSAPNRREIIDSVSGQLFN